MAVEAKFAAGSLVRIKAWNVRAEVTKVDERPGADVVVVQVELIEKHFRYEVGEKVDFYPYELDLLHN